MDFLLVLQVLVSIVLIFLVMIQSQGTGLGKAWGGSGTQYRSKKGIEKGLFFLTVTTGTVFGLISLANLIF
jgi:protein translocase SecG subunit